MSTTTEFEWPYLISLAETDTVKEYDTVRPIALAFKSRALKGKTRTDFFNEVSKNIKAVPGKFNFDRIMDVIHVSINLTDEQLIEIAGPAKVEFEREFGAQKAIFDSGVADMHWFDLMLKREDLALMHKVYQMEGKRRGISEKDMTSKAVAHQLEHTLAVD